MSSVIPQSGTVSTVPSSYDTKNYKFNSASNITSGYSSSNSTTYATINLTSGSYAETYIYYKFDLSSIPAEATIDSITCTAKAFVSNANTRYINSAQLQMFTGLTAKGSATSLSTSANVYTLTAGTWTRNEILDARVRVYAKRGTRSTSSSIYIGFYGASISVTYTYYAVQYTVTVTNYTSSSITPASQDVVSGNSATVQVAAISGLTVHDNDVDVTNQFVLNGGVYKYTISNIDADHTILVTQAVYFKRNGSWVRASIVWKKVNGAWIRQYTITSLIDTAVAPYMEFPFLNNSLTENELILSDNKKLVKGN